jgi:tetratricopeptide (TPR) repeat protein
MQAAIAAAEALGSCLFRPTQLATLAGAYGKQGDSRRALELVEQAIAIAERTGEKQALAAIQRLQGEILLAIGRHSEGEASLRLARQIAQGQAAVSEARRIETSLARLASSQRQAFDRQAPADARGWFGMLRALLGF